MPKVPPSLFFFIGPTICCKTFFLCGGTLVFRGLLLSRTNSCPLVFFLFSYRAVSSPRFFFPLKGAETTPLFSFLPLLFKLGYRQSLSFFFPLTRAWTFFVESQHFSFPPLTCPDKTAFVRMHLLSSPSFHGRS